MPFFKIMKWTGPFEWTQKADQAFRDLKEYLATPPIMVAPLQNEPLFLYLTATSQIASVVLVAEWEGPAEAPEHSEGTLKQSGEPPTEG